MNPHGQISAVGWGGGGVVRPLFWVYSRLALLLCEPNLISSFAISYKKLAATSAKQPEKPPKSTAQLFTISWLSEICVILINLGIRRLKYHTYINL